jgi:hypothetical protein
MRVAFFHITPLIAQIPRGNQKHSEEHGTQADANCTKLNGTLPY